jgi:5-methylcytosine-specific restriction endonuclease McrA
MNSKRIRVKSRLITQNDNEFIIKGKKISLVIPKSYILKTNNKESKDHWTSLYLDPDFFKSKDVVLKLRFLKDDDSIYIYGRKSFGIIWDNVANRVYSRQKNICFFCDEKLYSGRTKHGNKTKDHLIPTVMVKAYGFNYIDDNLVPACQDCNSEKASLHPYVFREKVKLLIERTGKEKWRKVLKTLNKILIEKHDIFR